MKIRFKLLWLYIISSKRQESVEFYLPYCGLQATFSCILAVDSF